MIFVYIGGVVIIAAITSLWAGYASDDDLLVTGYGVAPMWPLVLMVIVIIAPFLGLYKLGALLSAR